MFHSGLCTAGWMPSFGQAEDSFSMMRRCRAAARRTPFARRPAPRENGERRWTNDILDAALIFFATELDARQKKGAAFASFGYQLQKKDDPPPVAVRTR